MPISVVFDPPLPSDSPSTFNTKAFTLLGDLNDWSTQANALPGEVATNLSALLAAPPAIGSTTPAAGSFTTLSVSTGPDGISVGPGTGTSTRANIKFKGTDAVGVSVPWVVGSNIVSTDGSLDFYNGGLRSCLSTTGLAVTGTLSATGNQALIGKSSGDLTTTGMTWLSFQDSVGERGYVGYGAGDGTLNLVNLYGTLTIGANGDTRATVSSTGLAVTGALTTTGTLGYGVGAGGTVTQATNKSTAVTLNKPSGQITMNNEALAAGASVYFAVYNSFYATTDLAVINVVGGIVSPDTYDVSVTPVSTGIFYVNLKNRSAGPLSDSVVVGFAIIKGATS